MELNGQYWNDNSCMLAAGSATACQVEGCTSDLSLETKVYCLKKRICSQHLRAEYIQRRGDTQHLWRFCFQCGKLEPLSRFDGAKRSCRARLERRKLPPRRSMTWSASSAHAQDAMSGDWLHHRQGLTLLPDTQDNEDFMMELQPSTFMPLDRGNQQERTAALTGPACVAACLPAVDASRPAMAMMLPHAQDSRPQLQLFGGSLAAASQYTTPHMLGSSSTSSPVEAAAATYSTYSHIVPTNQSWVPDSATNNHAARRSGHALVTAAGDGVRGPGPSIELDGLPGVSWTASFPTAAGVQLTHVNGSAFHAARHGSWPQGGCSSAAQAQRLASAGDTPAVPLQQPAGGASDCLDEMSDGIDPLLAELVAELPEPGLDLAPPHAGLQQPQVQQPPSPRSQLMSLQRQLDDLAGQERQLQQQLSQAMSAVKGTSAAPGWAPTMPQTPGSGRTSFSAPDLLSPGTQPHLAYHQQQQQQQGHQALHQQQLTEQQLQIQQLTRSLRHLLDSVQQLSLQMSGR